MTSPSKFRRWITKVAIISVAAGFSVLMVTRLAQETFAPYVDEVYIDMAVATLLEVKGQPSKRVFEEDNASFGKCEIIIFGSPDVDIRRTMCFCKHDRVQGVQGTRLKIGARRYERGTPRTDILTGLRAIDASLCDDDPAYHQIHFDGSKIWLEIWVGVNDTAEIYYIRKKPIDPN